MSRYGNSKVSPAIYAPRQGEEWRGGDEAPRILHLGIRGEWSASRCSRFTLGEGAPVPHRGPISSVSTVMGKRKIIAPVGTLTPVVHPVASHFIG